MKHIWKDNSGSTMVEAAIYFPLILIMVVGMVVIAMYKLDKMMTQACMSEQATEIQSTCDHSNKSNRFRYWGQEERAVSIDYYIRNSIFTWDNPSDRQYIFVNQSTANPILQIDYMVTNNRNWFGLASTNTTHGAIVLNNPTDIAYTLEDIQTVCQMTSLGTVLGGKTGYTYEDYLIKQFGY